MKNPAEVARGYLTLGKIKTEQTAVRLLLLGMLAGAFIALAGAAAGGAIYFALLSGFAMPVFGGAVRTLKSTLNRGRGALQWCVSRADSEKIREIRKKVCKTLFTFSRKRYKIKSKSVQRQER